MREAESCRKSIRATPTLGYPYCWFDAGFSRFVESSSIFIDPAKEDTRAQ